MVIKLPAFRNTQIQDDLKNCYFNQQKISLLVYTVRRSMYLNFSETLRITTEPFHKWQIGTESWVILQPYIHSFVQYDSENVEMCSTDSKAIKILQSSIPISSNKMLKRYFFNNMIFSSIAFYQLLRLLIQPPRLTQHCQSYLPFHPTSLKRLWNKQTKKMKYQRNKNSFLCHYITQFIVQQPSYIQGNS